MIMFEFFYYVLVQAGEARSSQRGCSADGMR